MNELFETSWCQVLQGGVFSFEVVVADVSDSFSNCFLDVFVFGQFEFRLEGSKEAFFE